MLVDEKQNLRKLACSRIQKARESENADRKWKYQLPQVNFEAKSYADMTTWNTKYVTKQGDDGVEMETHVTEYTDPPILSGYSVQEIKCMAKENMHFISFPATTKRLKEQLSW